MKKLFQIALIFCLLCPSPGMSVPPQQPQQAKNQLISLNFRNTDIDLVLRFFSDVTGTVFIKSDLVRGFVTVVAPERVSREKAMTILQTVLEVKGFTMVPVDNNLVKVLTHAEAVQSSLEVIDGDNELGSAVSKGMMTQIIYLKFVAAEEMKAEISALVSKGGIIIADQRTNALVVTDIASNIRRLQKIIKNLDVRTPQVLIEALIMEVSLTDQTKLGLEWSYNHKFEKKDHKFSGKAEQSFSLPSFVTEGIKYSILRSDQNLTALVQALVTNQDVNILSTPHILTLNNQKAVIRVGEEIPILTQTRNVQGGDTIRSFDYKSVAVELKVTPRINYQREVTLQVHPLIKKILGFNSELNAPILATREAETTVLVKDGQTVVIGGLMKDDESVSQSKVPILGDIPILGMFFRKKEKTKEKTELLVFITPRVILSPDEAREMTIQKKSEMKEKR